jgi:prepilin-type N-terminal cleavage/methylation domain-containing protein
MERAQGRRSRGFTLLEMTISLGVIAILLASVFSIIHETYAFIGSVEADFGVQDEANQSFQRMTEVLRKCGWSTLAGVDYPRVTNGGAELEFRVLRDLDGNGYPFDAATGALEFSPVVYRIRVDGNGNLRVYNGAVPVWHLCRYVDSIQFQTVYQDPALQMKEIRITIRTRKMDRRGDPVEYSLIGSINMRN